MLNSILDPIAKPIAAILAGVYSVIPNYGAAIIGLSLLWMIIIAPLTLKSTRSMLAMQALQPEIKRLQEKHRNDKQAFAQAQMELFRERKVSPLSSCLPSLLPLPVFIALFRVIDGLSHTVTKTVNGVKTVSAEPKFLDHGTAMYKAIVNGHGKINAFGLNLADNAFSHHSSALAAIPFFVLLLIMIGTSYLQTSMMMNRNPAASQNPQMKYMKYLPVVFGVICARFPAGVVMYYAVSNICRIGQQFAMYRWDPKVRALVTDEVRDVEARTRDIDNDEGYTPDYDDDTDAPAVTPRSSFRELLAQSRKPPPPPPENTKTSLPKPKPNPSKDRPGSVKANRNRNGNGAGSTAARSTRQGGSGTGSVKRPGSGSNGAGGAKANGSSNGSGGRPRKGTGSSNGNNAAGSGNRAGSGASNKNPKTNGAKTNGSASGLNGSRGPRSGAAGARTGGVPSPRNRRRRGR